VIREPRGADIATVMALSLDMKEESPVFRDSSYVADKHFAWLRGLQENENQFFVVDEVDGEIAGFFVGGISSYFFNYEQFAEDYTVYVSPKFRSTGVAVRLIKAFERWAEERGAIRTYLGTNVGIRSERFVKFLKALGYGGEGAILYKDLS